MTNLNPKWLGPESESNEETVTRKELGMTKQIMATMVSDLLCSYEAYIRMRVTSSGSEREVKRAKSDVKYELLRLFKAADYDLTEGELSIMLTR